MIVVMKYLFYKQNDKLLIILMYINYSNKTKMFYYFLNVFENKLFRRF